MKILVIPDVHLKPYIFDKAEELLDSHKIDHIVFIGDLVDDWHQSSNIMLYDTTINRAIKFKKDHPNSTYCWGNHEVGYLTSIKCAGNSSYHFIDIRDMLKTYEKEVNPVVACCFDKVVFSHAGFVADDIDPYTHQKMSYKEVIDTLYKEGVYYEHLYGFMQNQWNSPLWARPDDWTNYYNVPQVIGHSPVQNICEVKPGIWDVDVFSTIRETEEYYGDKTFLIIDTITLETEIVS